MTRRKQLPFFWKNRSQLEASGLHGLLLINWGPWVTQWGPQFCTILLECSSHHSRHYLVFSKKTFKAPPYLSSVRSCLSCPHCLCCMVQYNPPYFDFIHYQQIYKFILISTRKWRGTKKLLNESESGEWKVGLKLNIQKMKIITSGPITSWEIDGETVETVSDFILGGSKTTAGGDCSH